MQEKKKKTFEGRSKRKTSLGKVGMLGPLWKCENVEEEELTSATVKNVSGYKLTRSGIANISQIEY